MSWVPAGEPAVRAGVETALTTPAYRAVFKESLGDVHDQLTSDHDTLQLNIAPAVDLARAQLAGNPRIANALPPGSQVPPIELARRSDVPVLWGAVDAAQRIALVTPLLVLALVALAVAMARRRWLTLGIAGAVVAGVSLLLLGLIAAARQLVGRRLDAVVSRDAFDASWDVIARSLAQREYRKGIVGWAFDDVFVHSNNITASPAPRISRPPVDLRSQKSDLNARCRTWAP